MTSAKGRRRTGGGPAAPSEGGLLCVLDLAAPDAPARPRNQGGTRGGALELRVEWQLPHAQQQQPNYYELNNNGSPT